MLAVGIGDGVSYDELKGIASDPKKFVFHVDDFGALETIKAHIISVASKKCVEKSKQTVVIRFFVFL